jgi:outer membrane protein TolC
MRHLARTAILALAIMVVCASATTAAAETDVLALDTAVKIALARDVLVRQAQHSLDQARRGLITARAYTPILSTGFGHSQSSSAGLDPQSTISGTEYSSDSYSTSLSFPFSGGMGLGVGVSAYTDTTNSELRAGGGTGFTYAGASVGANLYRPLGIFRDERVLTEGGRWQAELSLRGAELSLAERRRQVVGDILDLFFGALQAQRQGEITEQSKQNAEESLRIARAKLDRGKLPEIDVMEAEVSADATRAALRSARAAAAAALDRLKNALGIPLERGLELQHEDVGIPAPPLLDESDLVARALRQRADLQHLALGTRQAELSVRQAEAESRPGVAIFAGYSRSGGAETISGSFAQLRNPSWSVGLSTNTSLTRTEDRAAIDGARSVLRLLQMEEQLLRDDVRLELRQLVREIEAATANMALLSKTVRVAEENLRIRRVQFEHGLQTPSDVTTTEHRLTVARMQLLDAIITHELAAARLSLAVGEVPAVAAGAAPAGENKEVVQR